MNSVKFTYFDFPGGRGEPIRMVLSIAGIQYEDERISFEQFGEMRSNLPLKAVPVMETDGVTYTQTNAMLRYAGRLANLYPSDAKEAFACDEILDIGEDVFHGLVKTLGLEGDELKQARDLFCAGILTDALALYAVRLEASSSSFVIGDTLSIADIKIMGTVQMVLSGMMDHVPTDLVEKTAPTLLAHLKTVSSEPRVAAYLATLATD